jgi:hypothetical protein
MRCKQTWNRHKWTERGEVTVCRRCGKERNPAAGKALIEPKKPWDPGKARRNALRAAYGFAPLPADAA